MTRTLKLRFIALATLVMLAVAGTKAQTDFTGRIYYNANILKEELAAKMGQLDSVMTAKRAELIASTEKEKGRKLTADEMKKVDEKLDEAKKLTQAMTKGMTTSITLEFKSADKCVMKMDVKVKEDVLKAAGMGWAKRKLVRAAMAIAPSSHKATYVVSGNLLILDDGEDKDTLTILANGQKLSGKADDKNFILTRTK